MSNFIKSDINEMVNEINTNGLLFGNRYEVIINPPKIFSGMNSIVPPIPQKQLTLRCNSASLPGRSLTLHNYKFYGPQRQFPTEPLYAGDLSVTYVLSKDMRERIFFEQWFSLICNPVNYKISFFDDYVSDGIINILDKTDQVVFSAVIEEMYPKQIGDISLGYDKDEMLTQDITFVYRKYSPQITISKPTPPQIPAPVPVPVQPSELGKRIPMMPGSLNDISKNFMGFNSKNGTFEDYGSM